MSSTRPGRLRRALVRGGVIVSLALLTATGLSMLSAPVDAAGRGVGFGTFAAFSPYGWHGSMAVGGLHTYCIMPGAAAPVGDSVDQGVSTTARGMSPQQLTGINLLVSKYGQTSDPVQAAAVAWAVKTVANRDAALHAYGYRGDSIEGAVHWSLSAAAPEHDAEIQRLAAAYYAEATSVPAGPAEATGTVSLTTDPVDVLAGAVTVSSPLSGARGSLELTGAVFTDSGSARLDGAVPGVSYAIRADAPTDATTSATVSVRGDFEAGYLAAIRHFTTPGGQDTAGPAGPARFHVETTDAAPRVVVFAPTISTQVAARYVSGGPFVDTVAFAATGWPRTADGGYAVLSATATIYRTPVEPAAPVEEVPADAEPVATLALTTDPSAGPTVAYEATSPGALPGPGAYTAVWEIHAEGQETDAGRALDAGYAWREAFGEPTQTVVWTEVSSRAEPSVAVGATMSDTVVVGPGIPASGLTVSTAVFRAPDAVAPAEACTAETLVWQSEGVRVTRPGEVEFTAPVVPDFGTYYWRESATDAAGAVVHAGPCGVAEETTVASAPTVATTAQADAAVGAAATDTARVDGAVPLSGATELVFEVYRAAEGVPAADACTPEALVRSTESSPVPVASAGEYESPEVILEEPGTYFWIETLRWTPEGAPAPVVLGRGACGVADEQTTVAAPVVSTRADAVATIGEPFGDTATITGLAPDAHAEVMFFLYANEPGQRPTCTAETLEATTAAVPVVGDGEYSSPTVTSTTAGVKRWVAHLTMTTAHGQTVVLHRGACDDADEQTRVTALAVTGTTFSGVPLIAGGIGAVAIGGTLLLVHRRRTRFGARPTSG